MIIDKILDRKDGFGYNPREFYYYLLDSVLVKDYADSISRAMDYGTNEDIQKALCNYIIDNEYNPAICDYINSVNWLEEG